MRKEFILVASVILINLLLVSADTSSLSTASIGIISSKDQWVYDSYNSDLKLYFQKQDDKTAQVCLYDEKSGTTLKETINLYDQAKSATELRLQTFLIDGKSFSGYCYTPKDETYLNFDDSVVISFEKPQYVKYEKKEVSINLTLYKEGYQFSDVWVNQTAKVYKFGAEDKYNKGLNNYTYTIKTSTPIISADKPYTYRTYRSGLNVIQERHILDFNDICDRGFDCTTKQVNYSYDGEQYTLNYTTCKEYPECEFKYIDDYTMEVKFKSDHFIDPTILISDVSTADAAYSNVTSENNFTHLNISTSSPYNNLVLYYSFDQNKSDYVYDYSKNNLDGTLVFPGNNSGGWSTSGYIGGAYVYSGNTGSPDYINVSDSPLLDFPTNSFSISLWLKSNNLGKRQPVLDKVGTTSGYKMFVGIAGYLNSYINDTTHPNAISINSAGYPFVVEDGSWHNIVCVYNRTGNMTIYVDTLLTNTINMTNASGDISSTNNLYIGYEPSTGSYFNGTIDELMIFNTSLTTSQISDIYNNISKRFAYNGTQSFGNQSYMNISNQTNMVQIVGSYENLLGSSIGLKLGYFNGAWDYTSSQTYIGNNYYSIPLLSTNITLNFTLFAGNNTNPFYSPTLLSGSGLQAITSINNLTINTCGSLTTEGAYYNLTANVTNTGTADCLIIANNSITLDCKGYKISTSTYSAITLIGNNITVKNCLINTTGDTMGIKLYSTNNSIILNNTLSDDLAYQHNTGISFMSGGYNSLINNTITAYEMNIQEVTSNNIITGNTVYLVNGYSEDNIGLMVRGDNNSITGNNFYGPSYFPYLVSIQGNNNTIKDTYMEQGGLIITYANYNVVNDFYITDGTSYSGSITVQVGHDNLIMNGTIEASGSGLNVDGYTGTMINTTFKDINLNLLSEYPFQCSYAYNVTLLNVSNTNYAGTIYNNNAEIAYSCQVYNQWYYDVNLTIRKTPTTEGSPLLSGALLNIYDNNNNLAYSKTSDAYGKIVDVYKITSYILYNNSVLGYNLVDFNDYLASVTLNGYSSNQRYDEFYDNQEYKGEIYLTATVTTINPGAPSGGGTVEETLEKRFPRNDTLTPPTRIGNITLPVCGNLKCDGEETTKTCPIDCGKQTLDRLFFSCFSKDDKEKENCIVFNSPVLFWGGLGAILLSIGAFGTTQVVRRRKKTAPKKLYQVPRVVQHNGQFYKLSPVAKQMIKNNG